MHILGFRISIGSGCAGVNFRFGPVFHRGSGVTIRRDPVTGDVILSEKPDGWGDFFENLQASTGIGEFLDAEERLTPPTIKDPFEGWEE